MGNRLYGYEEVAERIFQWNYHRFPPGSWLSFDRVDETHVMISMHCLNSTMVETTIENIERLSKKELKIILKHCLKVAAMYCESVASVN